MSLIEEVLLWLIYIFLHTLTEDDSKKIDCTEVLAELETINEDLAEIGILLVTTAGKEVASENGKIFGIKAW